MGELVERTFPTKSLLLGLRAIGYSFPTAVADIIDNSISAESSMIKVYSDPLAENPYFCILDNGYGMSSVELDNALQFGSDRSDKEDGEIELGRFGLGLKSASLSQCKKFTVISKKYGKIRGMSFDLDVVNETNKLLLEKLDDAQISMVPYVAELDEQESGTIVVWNKFDKLEGFAKDFEESFRMVVSDSKKHVELVFHRFYSSIQIFFNGKRIEKRDPFLTDSEGRIQKGRSSDIPVDGSSIIIIPYTLPPANSLSSEEKTLLGNPKSIFDEQGFYLYRNKRLISWGSWMRMGVRSELNKLARIQVDIPSSLDAVWMLDVKKSSAKIPDKIKDRIKIAVEDSIVRSKRTTKFPGVKEQSVECKVWDRINEHEGKVRYQINRNTPAILALDEVLGNTEKQLLEIALSQIEAFLPKYSISNDNMDALSIVNSGDDSEEEHLIEEIQTIITLYDDAKKASMFDAIFMAEGYQKLYKKKNEIMRRIFGDD
ncbi:MAG: ATP-binding protein [Anaerovoracaceae bacterium]